MIKKYRSIMPNKAEADKEVTFHKQHTCKYKIDEEQFADKQDKQNKK